jgi:hypothetical protein
MYLHIPMVMNFAAPYQAKEYDASNLFSSAALPGKVYFLT